MKILIVEDNVEAALSIQKGLSENGMDAQLAHEGQAGLKALRETRFDVVVLDRMMPGMDGITMLETARAEGIDTPVLFLSALGELEDRVSGLRAGADDYLVKPYALSELVARIEVLARRKDASHPDAILRIGELEMNLIARSVMNPEQCAPPGASVNLAPGVLAPSAPPPLMTFDFLEFP